MQETHHSSDELTQALTMLRKYKKIVFIFLSIGFLFCFFVFSVLVKKDVFKQLDFNTTVRLQDHIPLRLDKVFPFFSSLASIQGMAVLLIIILIFRKQLFRGIIILIIFFGSHSVELFGKVFINHPPPPFMFYRHAEANTFTFDKMYVQNGNSYPSGHSFRTVFVSLIFVYTIFMMRRFSRPVKFIVSIVVMGVICLVGISRISLGEHWTTDVIGGGLFGFAAGFFSLLFL